MIKRTAFQLCITMTVLLASPSWAQDAALNGDQIKLLFVGNTLEYVVRDETIKVYFEPDGSSIAVSLSKPGNTASRSWWIKNGNALCRTVRKNAVHCVKVHLGPKPDVYKLVNLKGNNAYLAMVLPGNQLQNSEQRAASETDNNKALSGDRIKQILIGNTMEFGSSRGTFNIYFKGNNTTIIEISSRPDWIGQSKWTIEEGNILCRELPNNREFCAKIYHGLEPGTYLMNDVAKPRSIVVTVHTGNQLPQFKRRAAMEARLAKLEEQAKLKNKQLAALQSKLKTNLKSDIPANINFGTYHALVIGINEYENLNPLKTAVADAKAVAEILKSKYGFKVTQLINPTHEEMLDKFDQLREELIFKDNLLIYYAGHGWLDKDGDEGYWLPANAKKNRRSRWVSNASVTTTLKALKAKHVMVIADSCFSGRLVRDAGIKVKSGDTWEYYIKMSRKKSRVVITSGGLEPVEDGKGDHSPFARAFLQALEENQGVLDGTSLFNIIRRPVMVNANQTPQYSDVRRAGHDGGDFLFVRRN